MCVCVGRRGRELRLVLARDVDYLLDNRRVFARGLLMCAGVCVTRVLRLLDYANVRPRFAYIVKLLYDRVRGKLLYGFWEVHVNV